MWLGRWLDPRLEIQSGWLLRCWKEKNILTRLMYTVRCSSNTPITSINMCPLSSLAYGVILYEMLTGQQFMSHISYMSRIEKSIIAGHRGELPKTCQVDPPCHTVGFSHPRNFKSGSRICAAAGRLLAAWAWSATVFRCSCETAHSHHGTAAAKGSSIRRRHFKADYWDKERTCPGFTRTTSFSILWCVLCCYSTGHF